MNLLEKQLITVYFKDARFPWITLYDTTTSMLIGIYIQNNIFRDNVPRRLRQCAYVEDTVNTSNTCNHVVGNFN